jgi:uncharacterized membrane protein YraQ (UPF0718 family)
MSNYDDYYGGEGSSQEELRDLRDQPQNQEVEYNAKTGKLTFKDRMKGHAKNVKDNHMMSLAVAVIALILVCVAMWYFFRTEADNMMGGGFLVGGLVVGGLAYYLYTQENADAKKKAEAAKTGGAAKKKAAKKAIKKAVKKKAAKKVAKKAAKGKKK